MNKTAGAKTFDLKWLGKVTPKQVMFLIIALVFALVMTIGGFASACMGMGMLMIAVVLFMLPRTAGVENIELMTILGLTFMVSAILVGGFVTAPGSVDSNMGNPSDNEYFENVTYTFSDSGVEINATLNPEYVFDPVKENVVFYYGVISGVGFVGPINNVNEKVTMTVTSGAVSGTVPLESDKLYAGYLAVTVTGDDGKASVKKDSETYWVYMTTEPFEGSLTNICLYGCFYAVLPIILIFFLMIVFTNFMRNRMEKTRARMEKEGRLYPKGYGRCEKCNAIVLPGELKCRKCGSYIERPEEMRPDKKDFFECSDCGAEVPTDAKLCPKCGAVFDEEEFVVTHSDGTVEQTSESFQCPECKGTVPGASTFCPRCGFKFKKK